MTRDNGPRPRGLFTDEPGQLEHNEVWRPEGSSKKTDAFLAALNGERRIASAPVAAVNPFGLLGARRRS